MYDSLAELISSQRDEFDYYEELTLNRSIIRQYKTSVTCQKKIE